MTFSVLRKTKALIAAVDRARPFPIVAAQLQNKSFQCVR
jgi:hypothetical protein